MTQSNATELAPTRSQTADLLDVEFGDLKLMTKGDGLSLFRPDRSGNIRIALLPYVKAKSCLLHYLGEQGSIRCLGGNDSDGSDLCCQRLGDPQLRVVALAARYVNCDKEGKLARGVQPEVGVGYVRLSRSNYRAVSLLPAEGSTVYDIDIVMALKPSGIGYDFTLIANTPRYKAMGMEAEVEAACRPFLDGTKLSSKLAKKVTELEFEALLSGEASDGLLADTEEE
jgi:hypothetical protein